MEHTGLSNPSQVHSIVSPGSWPVSDEPSDTVLAAPPAQVTFCAQVIPPTVFPLFPT